MERITATDPDESVVEALLSNEVVIKALMYETAWNRYSNPSTSLELDEAGRLLEKGIAHQALLDAVRRLRGAH